MAPLDELIGRTLGHFRVLSLIGHGGMGIVYRAEDLDLYRSVALKVLPPAWAGEEARRARFLREARSAAAVSHANIATIYEVGASDTTVFIAMELVRGETLRDALLRGVDESRRLGIALGIARGLARAHEVGVLHCDLKPENVMLDREGEPKILDFGLARAISDGPGRTSLVGAVVGTPGYFSPEQAAGAVLDARSDVFTLGIVLYEMYANDLPFDAADVFAVLYGKPAPTPPSVPKPVAAVIERCLTREPAERFADAGEVRDALLRVARASLPARTSRRVDVAIATGPTLLPPAIEPTLTDEAIDDGPFIGREALVADVVGRFDDGQRLVTLVGPGGIGKSRIAQRVALRLAERDRRPTIVVSLGSAGSVDDALDLVAAALGAELSSELDPTEALGLSLKSHGRLLLLLDEADSVARALARPIAGVLAAAPEAIALATSRERLGASVERVVEIGPLDLESGAELFLARARAARPKLEDDEETRAVAREIANRLDGSPLAIDLAAARAAVLTPSAIRDRLDDRLRLLSSREREGRHGSLRAVLEWSWSLLDEMERTAISQMSVFRGGASVDAAEAVVVVPGAYALDVLESLRGKSLLRVGEDRVGGTRFAMDESVRLYAEESLRATPDGWATACSRHAAHFGCAAREALEVSFDGIEARGDEWLEAERDNLFVAADRAIAGEGPRLEDGALAMAALGLSRGHHSLASPARDRIATLVSRVSELEPGVAVDLLHAQVRFDVDHGVPSSRERASLAVALAEKLGDPVRLVRARSTLVLALAFNDEIPRAVELGNATLADAERLGSPALEITVRTDLARAHYRGVEPVRTIAALEPAIGLARARGALRALPDMLVILGTAYGNRNEPARAVEIELEALEIARSAKLGRIELHLLTNLGVSLNDMGRGDEARPLFEEAIMGLERRGHTLLLGRTHANLGFVEHGARSFALARSHYERALALFAPTSEHMWRAMVFGVNAAAMAQSGLIEDAERTLDTADAIAAALEHSIAREVLAILRGHLDIARARVAEDEATRTTLLARARAILARVSEGEDRLARAEVIRSAARTIEWHLEDVDRELGSAG